MKLPRNLDDLVETGRSNLGGLVETGRHGLEDLVDGGRKGARRLYADGRGWLEEHLPDRAELARTAERGGDRLRNGAERQGRAALRRAGEDDRLRAPVRWIEARLPEPRRTSSVLWPSVLAAAGAGVAFWWWTSWSRGRAEAAERAALDAAGGAEGAAHPEAVMSHAAAPAGGPVDTPDASAAGLAEPAEQVMAHAPTDDAPAAGAKRGRGKATADEAKLLASTAAAGLAGGVEGTAPADAVQSLDESLAVQGSASGKGKPNGRAKPGGVAM